MKVVCDGCQAKYKLTDGRLAGRKLKFRCRKCGNTIVLDGAELSHTTHDTLELSIPADSFSQESVAGFESSAPEWYLSINGEPYGPCTTDQMASMLGDGQVPWDTYVWREGYPEWKAASDSRTLVGSVQELSAQAERDASFDREHGGTQAARGYPGDEDDWVGSVQPSSEQDPSDAEDAEYAAADESTFDGTPGDEPTKVGLVDPHTGRLVYGGEEASGLIDIRALSALAGSQRNPRFSARRSPSGGFSLDDDKFSLTSPGERLRGPNGVDTLAPVARSSSVAGKAVPLAILAGSALIAVAAFAAIYSTPEPGESSASSAVNDEQAIAPPHEATPHAEQAAPGRLDPAPASAPVNPAPETPPPVDAAAIEAAALKERKAAMALARSERAKRAAEAEVSAGEVSAAEVSDPKKPDAAIAQPTVPTTPAAKPASDGSRSIDELLEGAVVDSDPELDSVLENAGKEPAHTDELGAAETGAPAPDAAGLQPMPTREQVLAAMRAVEPDVRSCTEGQALESYTAAAAFSVTGATGRVGSVRVTGIQGPVGSCIARAVRNAIFPPFAKSQLRINFPFRLGP